MMPNLNSIISLLLLGGILAFSPSCKNNTAVKSDYRDQSLKLDDYWYQGKAEITAYTLDQNRYNSVHPGEAVLIFVTEDFLPDLQVKDDYPPQEESVKILKTNQIKRFTTGLYDYSMMTSVFTPVRALDELHSLKVTMSSQDWCGQSYHQVNQRNNQFISQLHSYFQKEADKETITETYLLEDEILNMIRLDYKSLPVGDLEIIPALDYLRLNHLEFGPVKVTAEITESRDLEWGNRIIYVYTLVFPNLNREKKIFFEAMKPYKIVGWDDSYPSSFDAQKRTTKARVKGETFTDYWAKNGSDQAELRRQLDLQLLK